MTFLNFCKYTSDCVYVCGVGKLGVRPNTGFEVRGQVCRGHFLFPLLCRSRGSNPGLQSWVVSAFLFTGPARMQSSFFFLSIYLQTMIKSSASMLVKWRWRILMLSLTVLIVGKQIYFFLSSWDCQHFLLSRFVDYCDPFSVCMYICIWLCVYACVYVYMVHIHVCTTEERGQKSWSVVFLHRPLSYFFLFYWTCFSRLGGQTGPGWPPAAPSPLLVLHRW